MIHPDPTQQAHAARGQRVSDERLAELETLAAKARGESWEWKPSVREPSSRNFLWQHRYVLVSDEEEEVVNENLLVKVADAEFIAAARNAIPDLAADLRDARTDLARLRSALLACESALDTVLGYDQRSEWAEKAIPVVNAALLEARVVLEGEA